MRVRLRNGYTQAYAQIMQHTHMHKAVTGRVEAKKLLSRRRQSTYRRLQNSTPDGSKIICTKKKPFCLKCEMQKGTNIILFASKNNM